MAEPDTVPMPGELRYRPLADCSAAGRMRTAGRIFPFRTPWRRGFRGVWSAAGASAPDHGTRDGGPAAG